MDFFAPRKALTAHLQQLVDDGVLRYVGQHDEIAEALSGGNPPLHKGVYVSYDNYSNVSTQAHSSHKMTQQYTVLLAFQNNRPPRSGHGHGMDDSGELIAAIQMHIEGLNVGDNARTRKRFTLTNSPDAFYRPGGWAYYPISFSIEIINTKTNTRNKP